MHAHSSNLPVSSRFKNIDEFIILNTIGRGGYSTVYLVEHKKTKKRYALKAAHRFKKDKDRSDRTYTEIQVLQKLKDSPLIISLKGWFEDKSTIYLVLPYVSGKDCAKYFKNMDLSENKDTIKKIIKQLVTAIQYIHSKGIVHRDIKLENILMTSSGDIKLIDFGLCAVKKDVHEMFSQKLGTIRYTAPELLKGEPYNDSVDIWGIGVCMFLLLTGKYPFDGSTKESITRRILEKTLHFSRYNLDRKEIKLLRALLQKDPDDRIEIEEILSYSYFS